MNQSILNQHIYIMLNNYNQQLETLLESDVVTYAGPIWPLGNPLMDNLGYIKYLNTLETLIQNKDPNQKNKDTLYILLFTGGGNIETVEKFVKISRSNYKEVIFIIPHIAMSAGTVWAMSGNKILMDYSSSLGPIDPQFNNGSDTFPVLGYLDKVYELLEKSKTSSLSEAEMMLLQTINLGKVSEFEQARNLSLTLLKEWLQKYQNKTEDESKDIANKLNDYKYWHSHGRFIDIEHLKNMGLNIEDYSKDIPFRNIVRNYNSLLVEYLNKEQTGILIHNGRTG